MSDTTITHNQEQYPVTIESLHIVFRDGVFHRAIAKGSTPSLGGGITKYAEIMADDAETVLSHPGMFNTAILDVAIEALARRFDDNR